jgi:hypothetical protein
LGSIDGVYATTAAWRDGLEVVSLKFNPEEVAYETLVEKANQFKCTSRVFAHSERHLEVARKIVGNKAVMADESQKPRFAKSSDQKYYLANSPLRSLPLCSYQMTKLNSAIGSKQPFTSLLSPRQKALVAKIAAKLKDDPKALQKLVSPADDNKLGAYAAKLEEVLEN